MQSSISTFVGQYQSINGIAQGSYMPKGVYKSRSGILAYNNSSIEEQHWRLYLNLKANSPANWRKWLSLGYRELYGKIYKYIHYEYRYKSTDDYQLLKLEFRKLIIKFCSFFTQKSFLAKIICNPVWFKPNKFF